MQCRRGYHALPTDERIHCAAKGWSRPCLRWVKNGSWGSNRDFRSSLNSRHSLRYEVPSPAAKAYLQSGTVIQENVGFDFEPASYPSDESASR